VRVLIHEDRRAIEGLDVEIAYGDVRDPRSLRRAFDGARVVYHAAVYISLLWGEWPECEAINVRGTRNVIQASLECGVRRVVHFSSIHALQQEPLDVPVDESRPLVVDSSCPPYDRSKAAAEREVREGIERGLDAIVVNPTAILGPHDYRPSHFGQVLLSLGRGRFPALVEGGFDWVDVRDVVEGALRAEEKAPTGASYLLSGHWVSLCEIAALIEEIVGVRPPRIVCPLGLARFGAPFITALFQLVGKRPLFTSVSLQAVCGNHSISHERATKDLAYHPRPFRESLVDTLRWFSEMGYLTVPVTMRSQET
jgi:dihydroflavonol-4-reductase